MLIDWVLSSIDAEGNQIKNKVEHQTAIMTIKSRKTVPVASGCFTCSFVSFALTGVLFVILGVAVVLVAQTLPVPPTLLLLVGCPCPPTLQ